MKDLKKAYTTHKSNAKRRGVGFVLSFEEWLSVWEASGKLMERGRGKEKYVMCRHGDCGDYTVDNVFIATGARRS